jgi:hypothetical protein
VPAASAWCNRNRRDRLRTAAIGCGEFKEIAVNDLAARIRCDVFAKWHQASAMPIDHRFHHFNDSKRADCGKFQHGVRRVAQTQAANDDVQGVIAAIVERS